MNEKEVAVILEYLSDIYPNFKFDKSKPELAARMVKSWHSVLGDFEFEDGLRVTKKIVLFGGSFAPNAGQIANEIIKTNNPGRMSGEEAYEKAICLAKIASTQTIRRYTSEADKFRQREEIVFKNQPETLIRAMRICGGLNGIGDEPNNSYARNNFIKTYESLRDSEQETDIKRIAGIEVKDGIGGRVEVALIEDRIKQLGDKFKGE